MSASALEQAEPVYQLLYISASNHDFDEEELCDLLNIAREKNLAVGVSGMLLYHNGSFIQALEGAQTEVELIYERIGKDPRHTESRILFRGEVFERDFDGWSMGFYRSKQSQSENLEGFHQFLSKGIRQNEKQDSDGTVQKALKGFREGKWRQHVDI